MTFLCVQPLSHSWKTLFGAIQKTTLNAEGAAVVCACRAKLGHGLLSGQYSKPPVKSELIEQVMNEEHKVLNWVRSAPRWARTQLRHGGTRPPTLVW